MGAVRVKYNEAADEFGVFAALVLLLVAVVLIVVIAGWSTMIGLGILHGELGTNTAVGFWSAIRVGIALTLIGVSGRASVKAGS